MLHWKPAKTAQTLHHGQISQPSSSSGTEMGKWNMPQNDEEFFSAGCSASVVVEPRWTRTSKSREDTLADTSAFCHVFQNVAVDSKTTTAVLPTALTCTNPLESIYLRVTLLVGRQCIKIKDHCYWSHIGFLLPNPLLKMGLLQFNRIQLFLNPFIEAEYHSLQI